VHRFPRTALKSLEQLLESGDQFQPARGGLGEGLCRSERTWRSLGEMERTCSFSTFFIITVQVSLDRSTKSEERFQTDREDLTRGWAALHGSARTWRSPEQGGD
jgi:hypothetical protein